MLRRAYSRLAENLAFGDLRVRNKRLEELLTRERIALNDLMKAVIEKRKGK